MPTNILEERGYFWWHGTSIPDGRFAPDTAVPGVLRIDSDGRSLLELDGVISSDSPFSALDDNGKPLGDDKLLQGILKSGNRYVLLSRLHKSGSRFSSRGISFEAFLAYDCLVGQLPFPPAAPLEFCELGVDLRGFEEWLRPGPINVDRKDGTVTATHAIPTPSRYELDDGTLRIEHDLDIQSDGAIFAPALELRRSARIAFTPHCALSLSAMQAQFHLLADLLILLTGSQFALDWPELVPSGQRELFRYYFVRQASADDPPKAHETVTNFPQIRDMFGALLNTWRTKRPEFGPAFYLYLGTRRGRELYVEHRFVNLIWGLESLHRKRSGASHGNVAIEGKVRRILAQVSAEKDRRWLRRQLRDAAEPNLAQRLFELLSSLPFEIPAPALRTFSSKCADLRNDISHFGGPHRKEDSGEFITDLARRNEAISHLYHALLLKEIGIGEQLLHQWVYASFNSYRILFSFVEAGLLPKSVLDQPQEPAPRQAPQNATNPL